MEQAVLGDDGQAQARRDEAVAQRGDREVELGLGAGHGTVAQPVPPQPREVVGHALALAAPRPGHHRPVAGADELLELGLGLGERPGREVGGLGPELVRLLCRDRTQPHVRALVQRCLDLLGPDVEVVGVGVVERGRHVLPVVGERGRDLLLGGDEDRGVLRSQVEERVEAVQREQLGDVGPLVGVLERRDLRQLAVLGARARRRARSRWRRSPPATAA